MQADGVDNEKQPLIETSYGNAGADPGAGKGRGTNRLSW